jgi:hypothetical protein
MESSTSILMTKTRKQATKCIHHKLVSRNKISSRITISRQQTFLLRLLLLLCYSWEWHIGKWQFGVDRLCGSDERRQNGLFPIIINRFGLPNQFLNPLHTNTQLPMPSQQFLPRTRKICASLSASTRTNKILPHIFSWYGGDPIGKSQNSNFETV